MSLRAFHEQYGQKGTICRLFTVYGERENETHAIPALIAKAFVRMDPYEIWGSHPSNFFARLRSAARLITPTGFERSKRSFCG